MRIYHTTVEKILKNHNDSHHQIYQDLQVVNTNLECVIVDKICRYLSELREELQIIVETDYPDPVYRDSYYHLYSTKLHKYSKNCIRFSFFEPTFNDINEFLAKDTQSVKRDYLGFLIIRPIKQCIGRNAIAVSAKKSPRNEINICKAKIKATCAGHKLEIRAFPHSSQDAEHMSCAENSAWTMLEYFGNKYAVYDPILPSQIIDSLQDSMYERLIPTGGLNMIHLSFVLKQRGFETKIYSNSNPLFKDLFTCYIESGLPLVVSVNEGENFGHAMVCVGRERMENLSFQYKEYPLLKDGVRELCFWNKCVDKFVVNDDNFPIYKIIDFKNPAEGYKNVDLSKCKITNFIVPLHGEIHVTAEIAMAWSYALISYLKVDNRRIIKTFLTTSRSYREYILSNSDFSSRMKQRLLQTEMPKFVWITEILVPSIDGSPMRAEGVIVLDSTGNTRSSLNYMENVIYIIHKEQIQLFNSDQGCLDMADMNAPATFAMFKGNLK